mgnify:FL=1
MVKDLFKDTKTIYFDFDGTLHNTIKIYGQSLRKGYEFLVENKAVEDRHISDEEAKSWLGYNVNDMWDDFLPQVDEDLKDQAKRIVGENLNKLLVEGHGELYPHAKYVLETLDKRGYKMIYLSNCKNVYKKSVMKAFGIEKYFDETICSESFNWMLKEDIVGQIRSDYPEEQIFVGDRFHDMEAGKANGLKTVFCSYGFGSYKEGKDATVAISDIIELLDLLP